MGFWDEYEMMGRKNDMEKHLLVTVSEQKSALYGIKFLGKLFSNKEDIKLTLLYTYSKSPVVWERGSKEKPFTNQTHQYEDKGKKALEDASKALCDFGFKEKMITTRLDIRKSSKAGDILHEGAVGHYDAVVLGKRGVGWIEEAFEESVTKSLMKETFRFPIWLCKLPESGRKGVLLCIDGSEASYRMADHVGFVLAGQSDQNVTLMTVNPDKNEAEGMLAEAKQHLLKHKFPEEMIKSLVSKEKNAAKSILKEAKKGKYAAVAVGRREREPKLFKNMFLGSVSSVLFEDLAGASLWICH
ncbi:MAG: universal stress protein [Desulfobacteraceae bacterium]|nr:universal stress protein [Desulfobacteraceae bacterium]